MNKTQTDARLADLNRFTGSEAWFRHGIDPSMLFTEGAKYVADSVGAYWLLDEIVLAQRFQPAVRAEEFQLWRLAVADGQGVLSCEDGNGRTVLTKEIGFTDFPAPGIEFYFCNAVIHLPSEY